MSLANFTILVLYAVGMSLGQVLFKISANAAKGRGTLWIALLATWQFYVAIAVYGFLALAWVWILTRIPLSRAYPFVVLAFVFTPLLAALVFGETLDTRYFVGLALIVAGLGVLASGTGG